MKQESFLIVLATIIWFPACIKQKKITDPGDYNAFLKPGIIQEEVDQVQKQIPFWRNRLQKDTGNFVDMLELASCHLRLFQLKGTIEDLHRGDSLLNRSSAKLQHKDPDILFALSQNSITQHRFKDAAFFIGAAGRAGGDLYTTRLLEFDTKMELGATMIAAKNIASLKDKSSFDYLIRKAKLEDQKGNLPGAIELMEQAFNKVKNGKKQLYCWALSSLADMYGHAGRIKDAYDAYLEVLRKDSSYTYALKGIAWIAYSHDHDTNGARRIYQYLLSQTSLPDVYLTLAEMEEWEGNTEKKDEYIRKFLQQVETASYGNMYNKYLIQLYTDETRNHQKALALAEKEITNRATPETYDWLGWVYFKKGQKDQACIIANNYVYKRNFEPDALFHTALIFSAAGNKDIAKKLLEECRKSAFEMGPVKAKQVRHELSKM